VFRRIATGGLFTACAILAGCRDKVPDAPQRGGPPRLLSVQELTEAEKRYGHAPTPNPAVKYQPDVVMLRAGAEAIRSVSSDGFVWTLDPDARGAGSIRAGTVLLLTSRAAGRVLGVQKTGDGLEVVLGPVEITEVIREGRFTLDQPVDLDNMLSFTVPEVFDPQVTLNPVVAGGATGAMVSHAGFSNSISPRQVTVHRFAMTPIVGPRGVGVRIKSNAGGVMFLGEAFLYLSAPRLYFNLDIREGRITVCEVQLNGAAGFQMVFEAASPSPRLDANINERRYAPVEFSIPVNGLGVPFAVTVRQIFQLQTAFTSTGSLKAAVHYKLAGGLRVGYRNGTWSMGGPTGVSPVVNLDNLLLSTQGAALGVTGMVMTHHASMMVGIGAFGFLTGPYGFLNTSVTVTRGSSAGLLQGPLTCKQATLSMGVGAGVGYMIPEPVTGAINSLLRALNIREEIKSSGGLETKPVIIVNMGRVHPALEGCGA
jgi:hypothetical protein